MMSSRPDELGKTLSLTYTLIQYELCVLYILALHTLLHCIVYPQPFCVCILKITRSNLLLPNEDTISHSKESLLRTAERV